MARMIPPNCSGETLSKAEIFLFKELKKSLDDTWTIFHSLDLLARNRQNKIIDAEIDFLLLNSKYGVLVIEVKGGQISFKEGQWFQYNKKMKLDPEKQARNNKHYIKNYLTEYLHADPPIPFGHAICFPDYYGIADEFPPSYRDIILTGKNFNKLKESIIIIADQFREKKYAIIDQIMLKVIQKALLPVFEYGASLIDRLGQDERIIFSLTQQQCELLNFISEHNRAVIKGCAGSGKTIMAVKKAKQLANENKSVLLLCYNNMLGDKLFEDVKEFPNITATTYHRYCIDILENNGYSFDKTNKGDDFWVTEIPNLFFKYIEKHPIKYDAVIIDEGQDFREEFWISLTNLIREDGSYYIFYDPDQNLFGTKLNLPKLSAPFVLSKNCRNSKSIFNKLREYTSMDITISDEAPEGIDINEYQSKNLTNRRNHLSKILHDLVTNQDISEEQIVILGAHRLSKSCIGNNPKVGKFMIAENGSSDKGIIPYYTYMKFKGLDSDVVILLDVSKEDDRWKTDMAMYTAISRAKYLLYIISKSN